MASNGRLIVGGPNRGEFIDGLKYPQFLGRYTVVGSSRTVQLRLRGLEMTEDENVFLFKAILVEENFTREVRGLYNTQDRTGIIVEVDEDPVEMLRARKEAPVPS